MDTEAHIAYGMALAMVDGHETPSESHSPPATPPHRPLWRPFTPSPPAAADMVGGSIPGTSRAKRARSSSPVPEVAPTLEILETRERELKRFHATFREEIMAIRGLGDTLPSEPLMEGMFNTMLQRQREAAGAKDDDRVIVEIANGGNAENPLWFNMRRADQINGRVILDKLSLGLLNFRKTSKFLKISGKVEIFRNLPEILEILILLLNTKVRTIWGPQKYCLAFFDTFFYL